MISLFDFFWGLCADFGFGMAFAYYLEARRHNRRTMAGRIVLSVGHYPHAPVRHGETFGCTPEQKIALDELHLRKIELADEVLVLNVGGYMGDSTRREYEHAKKLSKVIRFLEVPGVPNPPRPEKQREWA